MGQFQISDEQKELINKQFDEIRDKFKGYGFQIGGL